MNLDVAVSRAGQFTRWARSRPARRMPNGQVGVVLKGSVYPVHRAEDATLWIILEDQSANPEECAMWGYGQELVYTNADKRITINWNVETNVYGHYLVFDGGDDLRHDVIARLRNNDFEIVRHGSSIRPADDGHFYDWFARLSQDTGREEVVAALERVLGRSTRGPGAPVAPSVAVVPGHTESTQDLEGVSPETVDPDVLCLVRDALSDGCSLDNVPGIVEWVVGVYDSATDDLIDQQFQLESERDAALEQLTLTRRALDNEHETNVIEIREAIALTKKLEAQNAALTENLSDLSVETSSQIELEQEVVGLKQDAVAMEELLSDAALSETQLARVSRERDDLKKQIERMERNPQPRGTDNRRRGKTQRHREACLAKKSLFSYKRLKFVSGATEELIDKYPDPTRIFKVLDALDAKGKLNSTAISVAPGWYEVSKHIHTGDSSGASDRGRIYFCREDDGKLGVMIDFKHDSADQQRKFRNLGDTKLVRYEEC